MLNNYLAANAGFVVFCVIDILLILALAAVLVYMVVKPILLSKNSKASVANDSANTQENQPAKKENEESKHAQVVEDENGDVGYVIADEQAEANQPSSEPVASNNPVEHFGEQITNLNEEYQSEFKSNVVVRPRTGNSVHAVKDEQYNYNKSTAPTQGASFNDSSIFLDTIVKEQNGEGVDTYKPNTKSTGTTKKAKSAETKTAKTPAKKTTKSKSASATTKTAKKTDSNSETEKTKRKYTKKSTAE